MMMRNNPPPGLLAWAVITATLLGFTTQPTMAGNWRVENLAGTGAAGNSGDGGPALKAQLNQPFGVVRGPDGAIYFCEIEGAVVRKIDRQGIITRIAGTGRKGFAGDGGPALQAAFNQPHEVRFDREGDLYVSDNSNHRIRKIHMKTGLITTVAGTGTPGFSGDGGPATQAEFKQPISLQFNGLGDMYICDIGNHRIRKVDMKTGMVNTVAGNGQRGPTAEGAALKEAPIFGPRTLDFDRQNQLWVALREGNQVLRLDLSRGTAHVVAGTGKKGFTGHGGLAKAATLSGPKGLSVTPDGRRVFLADTESHSLRLVDMNSGRIELICGTGLKGDGPTGDAIQCQLSRPHAIFVETDGSLLVGDSENHRLRKLTSLTPR